MAATDEERREVAAKLRGTRSAAFPTAAIAGIVGLDDQDYRWREVFERLADLIEPSACDRRLSKAIEAKDELLDSYRAKAARLDELAALADSLETFREGACDGCVADGGECGRGCAEALARAVADGIREACR